MANEDIDVNALANSVDRLHEDAKTARKERAALRGELQEVAGRVTQKALAAGVRDALFGIVKELSSALFRAIIVMASLGTGLNLILRAWEAFFG